jgi:hypothetical protein
MAKKERSTARGLCVQALRYGLVSALSRDFYFFGVMTQTNRLATRAPVNGWSLLHAIRTASHLNGNRP